MFRGKAWHPLISGTVAKQSGYLDEPSGTAWPGDDSVGGGCSMGLGRLAYRPFRSAPDLGERQL